MTELRICGQCPIRVEPLKSLSYLKADAARFSSRDLPFKSNTVCRIWCFRNTWRLFLFFFRQRKWLLSKENALPIFWHDRYQIYTNSLRIPQLLKTTPQGNKDKTQWLRTILEKIKRSYLEIAMDFVYRTWLSELQFGVIFTSVFLGIMFLNAGARKIVFPLGITPITGAESSCK